MRPCDIRRRFISITGRRAQLREAGAGPPLVMPLVKAWMMLRDGQIYAPWYDGRVAAQRTAQGNFDAHWLHDQTVALIQSRSSYHRLPGEAVRVDAAAFAGATAPVHVAEDGDLTALILSILSPAERPPCPT